MEITGRILQSIVTEPVFRHPFWNLFRQASEHLSFDACATVFAQIDHVTAASREAWRLPTSLATYGFEAEGRAVERILQSEDGHQEALWEMMLCLFKEGYPREYGRHFGAAGRSAMVRSVIREVASDHLHSIRGMPGGAILDAAETMTHLFAMRRFGERDACLMSLGAMVAVECFANRSYVPGFIEFAVRNPRFGDLSIEHPALRYLADHAGESGAEAEHERLMVEVTAREFDPVTSSLIDRGSHLLCSTAERWYAQMMMLLAH